MTFRQSTPEKESATGVGDGRQRNPGADPLLDVAAQAELSAQAMEGGATKRGALVLDQAGWHMRGKVAVPEGISLIPLPVYSPELQPVERV